MFKYPEDRIVKWLGLPIWMDVDQLQLSYLKRIYDLLETCLAEHPRWTVVRIDLRSPDGITVLKGAITRFFASVKAQLEHARQANVAVGKRAYVPMLHYVWVREWNRADQPHYHVALLLNHDAYFSLGNYGRLNEPERDYDEMLAGRIYKAWGVALSIDWRQAQAGVHFPERPVSALMRNGPLFYRQINSVFYRLSYFAKLQTKRYGNGERNFGMSQLR